MKLKCEKVVLYPTFGADIFHQLHSAGGGMCPDECSLSSNRPGYISSSGGKEMFVLVIVFGMLVQHYRASLSDNNNLCTRYALLVKLLSFPLTRKACSVVLKAVDYHVYQGRHIIAYTVPRTTVGSAMTETDEEVLTMTKCWRKQGKTQKEQLGACSSSHMWQTI